MSPGSSPQPPACKGTLRLVSGLFAWRPPTAHPGVDGASPTVSSRLWTSLRVHVISATKNTAVLNSPPVCLYAGQCPVSATVPSIHDSARNTGLRLHIVKQRLHWAMAQDMDVSQVERESFLMTGSIVWNIDVTNLRIWQHCALCVSCLKRNKFEQVFYINLNCSPTKYYLWLIILTKTIASRLFG